MREASVAFRNSREAFLLKMHITEPSGRSFDLTYDDLSAFTYSANGTSASEMELGLAAACSVDFSIMNVDNQFSESQLVGSEIELLLGKEIFGDDPEYVPIGFFKVESAKKQGSSINVTSNDDMVKFNERFRGVAFPCTLRQLITAICNQAGIQFETDDFPNAGTLINTLEDVTSYTSREVLSFACELAGSFAIINHRRALELRWFNTSVPVARLGVNDLLSFEPDVSSTPPTVLSLFAKESETVYGLGDRILHMTDNNPLILNMNESDLIALIGEVYRGSIRELSYTPGTFSAIGNCLLEPGDVVECVDEDGAIFRLAVCSIKLSGNLRMDVNSTTASAQSSTSSSSRSVAGSSTSSKVIHNVLSEDIVGRTEAQELALLQVSMASGYVPVVFFMSNFTCSAECTVVIDITRGNEVILRIPQRCLAGPNTISGVYPLLGMPNGLTVLRLRGYKTEDVDVMWHKELTSFVIMGNGFHTSGEWNGVLELVDTLSAINVRTYSSRHESVKVGAIDTSVSSNMIGVEYESTTIDVAKSCALTPFIRAERFTVNRMTDSLTTTTE